MSLFDLPDLPSADAATSAESFLPADRSLDALRVAARTCRGCDLYAHATQTVFGLGPERARVMFVGEQPGDQEDRRGEPFVGPAGRVLRDALDEVHIPPEDVYITNAVKHFKFVERGKQRIHVNPKRIEVRACWSWLREEIHAVAPQLIVALGATAGQALLGPTFRVTQQRGQRIATELGAPVMATVHPSSILRAVDETARQAQYAAFVADLRTIAQHLTERNGPGNAEPVASLPFVGATVCPSPDSSCS